MVVEDRGYRCGVFWFLALPRLLSSRVLTRVLSFFLWGDLCCGYGAFVTVVLVGRYDRRALYRGRWRV